VQTREEFPPWSPELSLEIMDRHGIDVAITSYTQGRGNFAVGEKHLALTRRFNDYSAELCARWPRRFGAFAAVPLPEVNGSIAEIERALDELKFDGVCLYTNYEGKYLGDPAFDPIMELLNDRQAVLFVHPAMHPSYSQLALPWPAFMIEYPMDTTRAAVNMLFNGTLNRFPRIRIILAHAGGFAPYVAWRLSVTPMMQPRIPQLSREEIYAGLRHYWYDTALSPGVESMGPLRAVADPSKIVFGSDWPFTNVNVLPIMDETAGHLTAAQRTAIDRGNAAALFPRFS
jgi:predicted TIM-barrel fold metal-dependent hydrolase